MSLQKLLKERERIDKEIEKYEVEMKALRELHIWQDIIIKSSFLPGNSWGGINIYIPERIRDLFLNVLQSEINKLEKE